MLPTPPRLSSPRPAKLPARAPNRATASYAAPDHALHPSLNSPYPAANHAVRLNHALRLYHAARPSPASPAPPPTKVGPASGPESAYSRAGCGKDHDAPMVMGGQRDRG